MGLFDFFPLSRRCQQVPLKGWSSSFGGFFLHTTPQFTTTAEGAEDEDTFKGIRGNVDMGTRRFVGIFIFVCVK